MLLHVMGAMGSATGVVLLYGLLLALRPPSLLDAQYAVPILAMLLGHAISSVSLGLSTALEELSSGEVVLLVVVETGATTCMQLYQLHTSPHSAAGDLQYTRSSAV